MFLFIYIISFVVVFFTVTGIILDIEEQLLALVIVTE